MKRKIAYTPFPSTHAGAERLLATFMGISKLSKKIKIGAKRKITLWKRDKKIQRDEAQMWDFAKKDPRFMAEIQAAISRSRK